MELFTLDRSFRRHNPIDQFESAIWTERYYGDCEVELVVEPSVKMFQTLPPGTFLGLVGSKEVMILDTVDAEGGALKVTGKSLLPFLNNRPLRVSAAPEDRSWNIDSIGISDILWAMIYNMTSPASPYLNGTAGYDMGIPNPSSLAIPNINLVYYDPTLPTISVSIPYGPLYDAMRSIATAHDIGLSLTLTSSTDTSYSLGYKAYKGVDRTSRQTLNPLVRLSPDTQTLTNIKDLQSIATFKNAAYSFATSNPGGLATSPGSSILPGPASGFDLRVLMTFEDDISSDNFVGDAAALNSLLNHRAATGLSENTAVNAVDGEIVPLLQFQYGIDYTLGDIIEVQGNNGVTQSSRIVEYIRSQDSSGERAYPTVASLG